MPIDSLFDDQGQQAFLGPIERAHVERRIAPVHFGRLVAPDRNQRSATRPATPIALL